MKLLLAILFVTNAFALDWQGHRGARGLYPENTIGAMEEALKYPVTTLELDVVVSKDMIVVVSHEPWMGEEICLDPSGKEVKEKQHNMFKLTYAEIQKFDCGSKKHPRFSEQKKVSVGKPTLEKLIEVTEVTLKNLNRQDTSYNIEIKSTPEDEKQGFQPDVKSFSDLVIKTIRAKLPDSRYTIQSFDWRVLQYIHEAYPEVRLVALLEEEMKPADVLKKLGFKPYVFSPYFKLLSKDVVQFFHAEGIKVIPWTLNEVGDMKEMMEIGVDGIITDYPNRIQEALEKICKKKETFFEGKCVKLPTHAVPSDSVPGWNCKPGYVQKRMNCEKITVPKNARLTEDGKNWECLEGFRRYRGTCK